jgi:hypothetical protein
VLALPIIYFGYRLYSNAVAQKKLRETGIGKGAPAFITNVRKVAIPAHLAARIRRGEEVSGEEVTAALEAEKRRLEKEEGDGQQEVEVVKVPETVDQEWLPQGTLGGKAQGRRRKK